MSTRAASLRRREPELEQHPIPRGFEPRVDTDTLLAARDRYDDCHMTDSGEMKTAEAWAAILTQHR
jgi:hypothetical protein